MKSHQNLFTLFTKNIIVLCLFFMSNFSLIYAQVSNTEQASSESPEYVKAIENIPTNIVRMNHRQSSDYYNRLGEDCLKKDEIACAVLNFSRAIKASPALKLGYENLELAESKVKDRPVKISDSFNDIIEGVSGGFTAIGWFSLCAVPFLLYLLSYVIIALKKFKYPLLGIVLFAFCMGLIKYQYENITYGVVFETKVLVETPNDVAPQIRMLYEGTRIQVIKVENDWIKVKLSDGTVGWLNKDKIEIAI